MIQTACKVIMFAAYIFNIVYAVKLIRNIRSILPTIHDGTEEMTPKEKLQHYNKRFSYKFNRLFFVCLGCLAICIVCCLLNGNRVIDQYLAVPLLVGLIVFIVTTIPLYLFIYLSYTRNKIDLIVHDAFAPGRADIVNGLLIVSVFTGLVFAVQSGLVAYTLTLLFVL